MSGSMSSRARTSVPSSITLGSRLGIEEDNHQVFQTLPDDHPAAAAYHLYDWLSYLQETLVRALLGFDVDYPAPQD